MRSSERQARLNRTILSVQSVLADQSLTERIQEAMGGYPSTTYGQMTSRSHASPVEAQAQKKDPARADLDLLDELIRRGSDIFEEIDRIRLRYPKKRPGTVDKADDPGCEVCNRNGRWSPPTGDPSDLGLLPRSFLLCAVCRKMVLNLNRLPLPHEHRSAHTKGFVKMRAAK